MGVVQNIKDKGVTMTKVVVIEDPEIEMDKAMYGVVKVFLVSVSKNQYGGYEGAHMEVENAVNGLVGAGLWAESEEVEEGHMVTATVRVFRNEECYLRWAEDAPLREVAKRQPERNWK